MQCKNCRSEIREGNRYCTKCGFDTKSVKPRSVREQAHLEIKVITAIVIGVQLFLWPYIGISIYNKNKTAGYYDKLMCVSIYGNYFIKYNEEKIISVKKENVNNVFVYNSKVEKKKQKELGIKGYLHDFQNRFETATGGNCSYGYKYKD